MNSKRVKRSTTRLVAVAVTLVISVALLLLVYSASNAQTVTATPNTIDSLKPQQIKLQFKKDGLPDTATAGLVKTVRVGTASQDATEDGQGNITFTPPPDLFGKQTFQLLDSKGNSVNDAAGKALTVELTYAAATPVGSPDGTASPTPEISWVEKYNAEVRRNNLVSYWWYHPIIILVFVLLSGAFVGVITRGILFSRATFRTATGLPVGSFRAILAYTLVLFLGFYVLISLLVVAPFPPPEFLLGIVATVVGFYFGSRSGEEAGLLDSKAGAVRGIVRKGSNPVSGAVVKFKATDGTEPFSRITDVDGRFDLRGAKPGKYKVIAEIKSPPGTGEQEVSVTEGSDQEIEILVKEAGSTNTPPSQQTGTVAGVVKNTDGTAPSDATVELSQGGEKKSDGRADATGRFEIKGVKVGNYDAEAKSASAKTSSDKKAIEVVSGGQTNVELTLK